MRTQSHEIDEEEEEEEGEDGEVSEGEETVGRGDQRDSGEGEDPSVSRQLIVLH